MLLVGTSGFSYRHWKATFYPAELSQRSWLEYYAERFGVVELNVTYYRLPRREQFEQWAARTPPDFRFVVKGTRQITHYRRLRDVEEPLARFFSAVEGLAEKLDLVLWQLPPTLEADPELLATFCEQAKRAAEKTHAGREVRHAFEFRHASWDAPEVTEVLRRAGAGNVEADPSRLPSPVQPTAPFAYLRFHHGPVDGVGYERRDLAPFAKRARAWLDAGLHVYALFNNDPGGWAPRNAREFEELVGGGR